MDKKNILAIIPARGGSVGVKRKNIKLLGDKPLIGWTIDAAKNSQLIDRVVVTTEDDEITNVSEKFLAEVIKRPSELAQNNSPVYDCIVHVLDSLKAQQYIPDIIVLLQCTSPFRTNFQIDEALNLLLNNISTQNFVISVEPNEYPPYWLKKVLDDGTMVDFLPYDKKKYIRRQDFEDTYKLNGAIYAAVTEKFLTHKGFDTNDALAYIMDSFTSVDIDTESDFEYAKFLCDFIQL